MKITEKDKDKKITNRLHRWRSERFLGINKIKKEMEVHEVLMSNLMSNLGRRVKRKWWVFVCRV